MSEPVPSDAEFGTQPGDIEQFVGVINEIAEHNKQFSLGAAMASMFNRHIEVTDKANELQEAGLPEDEAEATADWLDDTSISEQQKIDSMVLGAINGPTLERTGLGLSPTRPEFHIASSKGVESLGPVRNQIRDGALFVGFLGSVSEANSSDEFKAAIKGVVGGAAREAYGIIGDSEDDSSVASETLAYAEGISREMDRLGIPRNELLDALSEYNKRGIVREYVQADRTGVLNGVGGGTFAPSEWQKDASSEFLASGWQAVLDAIGFTKANPNGRDFAAELIARAGEHLAFARADWDKMGMKPQESNGFYGQGFDETFDKVAAQLSELSSD